MAMQTKAGQSPPNPPAQLTSFIGREDEINQILRLLTDPVCRLLTLLGPGGIGKTRLALQITAVAHDEFTHGAVFVNLQTAPSALFLVPAIVDALGLPLSAQTTPDVQLQNYLHDKEMLLVLDSFEQLLTKDSLGVDGVDLLLPILYQAPSLKFLITSREVLNVQEEWQFPVRGLSYPVDAQVPAWESFDAVRLFIERARRVRPSFDAQAEAADILQICRLVDGTPLALELAATWTKSLNCQDIAAEIQRNIAFLETNLRNVPQRHRSMRAVFEQAWQQLPAAEQQVFQRLSVFRGGFLPEMAAKVAGASLPILFALVDKSLLRWESETGDGRYQMHELLRQYAADHLQHNPEEAAQTQARHCAATCEFLHQRADDLSGTRQVTAVQEIHAEWENVRAAWTYAVDHGRVSDLARACYTVQVFCDYQGRFREAADKLAAATAMAETAPPTNENQLALAVLRTFLGWTYVRVGRLNEARHLFRQSQETYDSLQTTPAPGFSMDPLTGLALVANVFGEYEAAIAYCEQAWRLAESKGDTPGLQVVWYVWSDVLFSLGEYDEAWEAAQKGYAACQATGNQWMRAYMLIIMGNIARARGEYDLAQKHFQTSYDLKDSMNDPEGMALAVTYLAQLALRQQKYESAWELYQQSLKIYREIFDQGGLVRALQGAGNTAVALNQWDAAVAYYREALQIACDMQWEPLVLSLLVNVAQLQSVAGRAAQAAELAAFVCQHPATEQETKDQARSLLPKAGPLTAAPDSTLDDLTAVIVTELETGRFTPPEGRQEKGERSQPLVDPLTPRELEVLTLIAEGMTNRDIAEHLVLSVGTVKSYTSNIYSKLAVSNRTQAVAEARDIGLIQ